jgi:hypothetical protein
MKTFSIIALDKKFILTVIMLSVIMLSVIMLIVIMLSVVMLSVIMLLDILPSVVAPSFHFLSFLSSFSIIPDISLTREY